MPYKNHRSVFKRMRQNEKRRKRNRVVRGSMRAILRAIKSQDSVDGVLQKLSWKIPAGKEQETLKWLTARMYSNMDKALKKGVIHRNKAARHKAQIAKWANRISAE